MWQRNKIAPAMVVQWQEEFCDWGRWWLYSYCVYPQQGRTAMEDFKDNARYGPRTHCWKNGPIEPTDGMGTTCMLWDGHEGPHEWTRDDHIVLKFAPIEPQSE